MHDYHSLRPKLPEWEISDPIVGLDKNKQINKWFIGSFPVVESALKDYIKQYWRPKYEKWNESVDGTPNLSEEWLFPPCARIGIQNTTKRNKDALLKMVKSIMTRAGISGPKAHAHAIRKGVVTELLRAGNTLKTVSTFVHHKSTIVTERSYDKRSQAEILEKMVLPVYWENVAQEALASREEINARGDTASLTNSRTGLFMIWLE